MAAGARPRTPLGELTTLPQTPSRLGRANPSPYLTPLSAFGASILASSALDTRRLAFRAIRRSILAFPLLLIYEMTTVSHVRLSVSLAQEPGTAMNCEPLSMVQVSWYDQFFQKLQIYKPKCGTMSHLVTSESFRSKSRYGRLPNFNKFFFVYQYICDKIFTKIQSAVFPWTCWQTDKKHGCNTTSLAGIIISTTFQKSRTKPHV